MSPPKCLETVLGVSGDETRIPSSRLQTLPKSWSPPGRSPLNHALLQCAFTLFSLPCRISPIMCKQSNHHSIRLVRLSRHPCPSLTTDSLKSAAKEAADAIMSMYVGNQPGQVPGIFLPVDKYYWWLGGANWNVLIRMGRVSHFRHLSITGGTRAIHHTMIF